MYLNGGSVGLEKMKILAINKKCIRCNTVKAIKNFSHSRRSPDGRQGYCKDCLKEYLLNIEDKLRGNRIKYAHKNKELIRKIESYIKSEHLKVNLVYDDQESEII